MRFSLEIEFIGNPPFKLPTNYRRNITSLIKEAIKRNSPELYSKYWQNEKHLNKVKDFTFSVYVPNVKTIKKADKTFLTTGAKSIKLNISSFDQTFIIHAYNAFVNLKDYTPFKYPVKLGHYYLHKQRDFNKNTQLLKTLSPVVVRKFKDQRVAGYLTHNDPEFCESLCREIHNLCSIFLPKDNVPELNEISVKPVKCRTVKISHYKEAFDATQGTFEISAPAEVIRFVYDAGLGARRSQGFGMMEVAE